jgi:hypothetical protein
MGIEHRPTYSAPFGWYDEHQDTSATKRDA